MNRREALGVLLISLSPSSIVVAAGPTVSTLIGSGSPGHSDQEVNNPYGLVIGPDGALYSVTWIISGSGGSISRRVEPPRLAGNGQRAYSGDGGPAGSASLNMPHEIRCNADSRGLTEYSWTQLALSMWGTVRHTAFDY